MAVITISRGSHSMGKLVAEKVADRLGYECISREILIEASDQYNIPELILLKAIHDPPSFLERFTHRKLNYITYLQCALAKHVCKDNVVYHGMAGHILLKSLSHVLKVRIIAELDRRVSVLVEREGVSMREARSMILKTDGERRKWSRHLFGADPWDPALYDLIAKVQSFSVDDAVDLICQSASKGPFKTTPESERKALDMALACQMKSSLIETHLDVLVVSDYGNILIFSDVTDRQVCEIQAVVESLASKTEGVNNVEVHNGVSPPKNAI